MEMNEAVVVAQGVLSSSSTPLKSYFTINTMDEVDTYTSIQGSIGAGKSTIVRSFKRYIEKNRLNYTDCTSSFIVLNEDETQHYFILVDEPLDSWTKKIYSIAPKNEDQSVKYSLLELFYMDMKNNGFLFQIGAFTTRLKKIIDTLNEVMTVKKGENVKIHIIAERSLRTDRLFFKNLYDTGVVSQAEWALYNEFFTVICNHTMKKENLMIYVETEPEKCHQRVDKRARLEEKSGNGIPLDYLQSLKTAHDEMIQEYEKEEGKRVIRQDFNEDMTEEEIDRITANLMIEIMKHVKGL